MLQRWNYCWVSELYRNVSKLHYRLRLLNGLLNVPSCDRSEFEDGDRGPRRHG
ncbi:hypothetical protein H6F75_05095 [Nodosilinea sp. FACHB-131]|uniref:hypothetical protein n=1 Tax=Cyanophyceae TaxID=3028117 RepID=UPI0016870418|nr:hypothetical protein [Nodosilinea sp. FACHB-131]MBD1872849.1 hypothetical protein [Nodosilinea sp. FACHB-131]